MKLEDYNNVTALIEQRNNIVSAIKEAEGSIEPTVDANAWVHLGYHEDGSGVDLEGCDILSEVLDAVIGVLKAKKESVECELERLGVEIIGGIEL